MTWFNDDWPKKLLTLVPNVYEQLFKKQKRI